MYILCSIIIWALIIACFYAFNKKSCFWKDDFEKNGQRNRVIKISTIVLTMILVLVPMGFSPTWNGRNENHHNQYELLARSFLHGHLYLEFDDIDEKLLTMDNPYDYEARLDEGVKVHWDSAFYNGKYYMYFGVVPVLVLFLPFRMITGMDLPTIMATRIMVALFLLGLFLLFDLLKKRFFKNIPLMLNMLLYLTISLFSLWYIMDAPELYCTAIAAGICCQVWSLYFLIRGVYVETSLKKVRIYALIGALFGALSWGCRPTVGLICLASIPIVIRFIKKCLAGEYIIKSKAKIKNTVITLIIAMIPYLLVALALMVYNQIRFENPFEFGQSYQMTVADQTAYGSFFEEFDLVKVINGLADNFIKYKNVKKEFPFIAFSGIFVEFPMLLVVFAVFFRRVREKLSKDGIYLFTMILNLIPVIITITSILWTPYLLERYKMDFLFLMGVNAFICIGALSETIDARFKNNFRRNIAYLCLITIMTVFLLFVTPYDSNFTGYSTKTLGEICKVLFFGHNFN